MCGIIAYLGPNDAFNYIISGLYILQNRGYDSAGICTLSTYSQFYLTKFASTQSNMALNLIEKDKSSHKGSKIGIGHTRWATHGAKTDKNAHPHIDYKGRISLVHNGIIENYKELKNMLINNGVVFASDTDTEVIANLISLYIEKGCDIIDAIKSAQIDMEGTWGLAILYKDTPGSIYLCRNGSPLLVGYDNDSILVSSEAAGFSNYIKNYIILKDKEIVSISIDANGDKTCVNAESKIACFDTFITRYDIKNVTIDYANISPAPYDDWMQKEIMEQSNSLLRAINMGGRIKNECEVILGGLEGKREHLHAIKHLVIIACGTSYNAALIGAKYFRELGCFDTVSTFDASEFELSALPKHNCGLLVLSQSGETRDVYTAIETAKANNIFVFSIVNVVGSLISRETSCGVYLNSGREVAVASTKSFTSQVLVLSLISIWFCQNMATNMDKRTAMITEINQLSMNVLGLTHTMTNDNYDKIIEFISSKKHCYILGKGLSEPVAHEGSLKMKEVAYIHTEGFAGGALKHGPFALIEKDTPIIFLVGINMKNKMESAAEEVKARGATTILITDIPDYKNSCYDYTIYVPESKYYFPIYSIIPLQYISYKIGKLNGYSCDYPRNLAKCVTTD